MRWSKITRFTRSLKLKRKQVTHLISDGQIHLSLQLFEGGCEKIFTKTSSRNSGEFMSRYFFFWHSFQKRPSCVCSPQGVAPPSCLFKTSFQPRVLTRHHLEEERSVQLQVAVGGGVVCSMDRKGSRFVPRKTKGLKPETCQLGKR